MPAASSWTANDAWTLTEFGCNQNSTLSWATVSHDDVVNVWLHHPSLPALPPPVQSESILIFSHHQNLVTWCKTGTMPRERSLCGEGFTAGKARLLHLDRGEGMSYERQNETSFTALSTLLSSFSSVKSGSSGGLILIYEAGSPWCEMDPIPAWREIRRRGDRMVTLRLHGPTVANAIRENTKADDEQVDDKYYSTSSILPRHPRGERSSWLTRMCLRKSYSGTRPYFCIAGTGS
ncbi:hypothetical protein EV424DRAFT_1350488 [Suillus variegatus]|nr:hypothetical protein EV424DRAFT_1350488 [Suillus variegatus]